MTKRVISFALWGSNPKYGDGALANAELAREIYPGWTCRFYIDKKTTPPLYWHTLRSMDHVEVVEMPEDFEGWKGMFARFLPADEEDVEMFISRDCDSRLTQREADAVQQWAEGPWLLHVMRDHPFHTVPILGGMWGAKRGADLQIAEAMDKWNKEDRWQTDQEFLAHKIWPKHYFKSIVHDDWNRFQLPGLETRAFPTPRNGKDFVGAIIDFNGQRAHPEHHSMI